MKNNGYLASFIFPYAVELIFMENIPKKPKYTTGLGINMPASKLKESFSGNYDLYITEDKSTTVSSTRLSVRHEDQLEANEKGTQLHLDNHRVAEGMSTGTLVGRLSIAEILHDTKVKFAFVADEYLPLDNEKFKIIGNKLRTRETLFFDDSPIVQIKVVASYDDKSYTQLFKIRILELPKFHLSGTVILPRLVPLDQVILVLYRKNEKDKFEAIEEQLLSDNADFSFIWLIQGIYTISAKFNLDHCYDTIYLGNVLKKARAETIALYEDTNDILLDLASILDVDCL